MTTQLPYEPPQYGAYPTSPPWADPAANSGLSAPTDGYRPGYSASADEPGTGYHTEYSAPPETAPHGPAGGHDTATPPWTPAAYAQHGQLLVPYPELMRDAGRPPAPSVIPTAIFTFLFGIFGAISAARRAGRAARGGNSRSPYWVTFGVLMVVNALAGMLSVAVAAPVFLKFREDVATKALQSSIRHTPPVGDDKITATSVTCTPTGLRAADGLRPYSCSITLSNGKSGTIKVMADGKGNGQPVK